VRDVRGSECGVPRRGGQWSGSVVSNALYSYIMRRLDSTDRGVDRVTLFIWQPDTTVAMLGTRGHVNKMMIFVQSVSSW